MVHLGSAALFTTSILFGGLYGGLGAAIGSALFDLFGGHTQYIVFSFFIKGIAGLIVGGMTAGYLPPSINKPTASFGRILVALIIGAIWTAFGYFIAWCQHNSYNDTSRTGNQGVLDLASCYSCTVKNKPPSNEVTKGSPNSTDDESY